MRFAFTEEQEQLRVVLRDLLESRAPSAAVREVMQTADGFDRGLWRELAELGVQGMAVPGEYGGLGFGFLELAIVLEEAGRRLLPAPLVGTAVLAVDAVVQADDAERAAELLPGLSAGTTVAAVARPGPVEQRPRAVAGQQGWHLDGEFNLILDAAAADVVIVNAVTEDGHRLFTVDPTAPGVVRRRLATMDQTLRLAQIVATGVAVQPLGAPGMADAVLERSEHLAATALALLAVGGADMCLATSVDYAKTRVQFGRPIGSFQAIQHMCADMLLETESARSAAYYAAWCAVADPQALPTAAAMAKSYAGEAYRRAAGQQIQIHGGIGFTWEHDAHLHLKRAVSLEALYGSPAEHRAALWNVIETRLTRSGVENAA